MDWMSMMSSGGGGSNETSSSSGSTQSYANYANVDFGNYVGGQTVANGSRYSDASKSTNTINWPVVIGVGVVVYLLVRGNK